MPGRGEREGEKDLVGGAKKRRGKDTVGGAKKGVKKDVQKNRKQAAKRFRGVRYTEHVKGQGNKKPGPLKR